MSKMINPFLSDEQFIGRDSQLSKKRSREDYLAAQAEGGIDAAIANSKKPERSTIYADEGWKRPKGMSRSGAMTPQLKSRLAHQEADGQIELLRNVYGEIEAFRPLTNESEEE